MSLRSPSRVARLAALTRLLAVAGVVSSITGCDSILGSEDPPIAGHAPLFSSLWVSDFDIGPDNRSVYYIAMDPTGRSIVRVMAIDVVTGERRTLVPSLPARNGMAQSLRAPGGGNVYVALRQDVGCLPAILTRVPVSGGPAETVAPAIGAGMFAVARGGAHIAFATQAALNPTSLSCPPGRDSVVVANAEATIDWRAVERGVSGNDYQPIALSDGGTLVYIRSALPQPGQPASVLRTVRSDGTVIRDIPLGSQPTALSFMTLSPDVTWVGENPQILIATKSPDVGVTISEVDAATGARTDLGNIPDVLFFGSGLVRSADGSVWATWVAEKNLTPNAIERPVHRYRLLVGRRGGTPQSMLTLDTDEGPRNLRLSPDGRQVAFVYRRGFYLIPATK